MRCDHCHEREAVIHLTQIADDKAVQVHLCEKCAAEKGVESATALVKSPLGGFLAQLSPMGGVDAPGNDLRCPRCGAGLADFREAGRLGCPECWEVFTGPLTDLVRQLHGATRHKTFQMPVLPDSRRPSSMFAAKRRCSTPADAALLRSSPTAPSATGRPKASIT